MLMNFDKLILPKNISTISTGGKRRGRKLSRKLRKSTRYNRSNKSRTRRRHY
jgi:hypothetical protein